MIRLDRVFKSGVYELIAGERRWRAAQKAQLAEIPALIRHLDDCQSLLVSVIENVQRSHLNPMELAQALHELGEEYLMTETEIAEQLGKDLSTVSHLLRLNQLPDAVKDLVWQGLLKEGHARVIAGIPESHQVEVARKAAQEQWTVRRLEAERRRLKSLPPKAQEIVDKKDPDVVRLEQFLSERLGSEVRLDCQGRRQRLIIESHNMEVFNGLVERLSQWLGWDESR